MAELKCRQLSGQLSSFIPAESLARMTPETFLPSLQSMMEQECFALESHEEEGRVSGYIIYARRQSKEPFEQIVEVFADTYELQQALIARGVDTMGRMGAKQIHVWILRENFRLRFIYEMAGFRLEGSMGSKRLMEQDFAAVLYQRQLTPS